jgi:stearoyl-CoA desaturase (Delta-9 desaturase)
VVNQDDRRLARERGQDLRDVVVPLLALLLPFGGFVVAVVLLWERLVGPADLVLFGLMYLLAGLGVTVGYHRLLTHRSFCTRGWVAYVLAALGSLAAFGPVIDWVADHRLHHAHTDRAGDPHSPHVPGAGPLRGLWHAHAGWLFGSKGSADHARYAPDLLDDPGIRLVNRAFPGLVVLSVVIPALGGWALSGTLRGAATAGACAGLARIFLFHHAILSVNSIGHAYGHRRFDVEDRSTNVAWLALVSLGESWHHNHHAFPRSARHGLRWFELDLSGLVIEGMARAGLAWNVVRIPRERQAARLPRSA